MHCTHTWRDRHDWIFVFLSILVYFSSIRSTWHLCWLQFIHQIPISLASLPRTVNWMHFSFYYIKPNQFVISSCRCLMLLLDCCFLRDFSLNTTARILIFSIALTWLICCGSATICMCIYLWYALVYVCVLRSFLYDLAFYCSPSSSWICKSADSCIICLENSLIIVNLPWRPDKSLVSLLMEIKFFRCAVYPVAPCPVDQPKCVAFRHWQFLVPAPFLVHSCIIY